MDIRGEHPESGLEPEPAGSEAAEQINQPIILPVEPQPEPELASSGITKEAITRELLQKAVARFQKDPIVAKGHVTAQKKYSVFCRNRTAELYLTFFGLVGEIPDCSQSKFVRGFTACVPFPGKKDERKVSGMATRDGGMQGLIRYEYKGNIIEESRIGGKEHGLRVVCTQMGDVWIRLFSNGNRLAQIVLCADCSVSTCPKPIDEGGLEVLRSHFHRILDCFEAKRN